MAELGVYEQRLTESGLRVFERAVEESRRHQQNYVSFGHILKQLAAENPDAFADALSESKSKLLLTDELLEKIVPVVQIGAAKAFASLRRSSCYYSEQCESRGETGVRKLKPPTSFPHWRKASKRERV